MLTLQMLYAFKITKLLVTKTISAPDKKHRVNADWRILYPKTEN